MSKLFLFLLKIFFMKTSLLSGFSLLLIVFMFFSCEQDIKKDLVGTWKLIQIPDPGYEEDWQFTDTKLILTRTSTGDTAMPYKNGNYTIKNNSIQTDGEGLASAGAEYYRGDFEIRSLTSTELILLRKDLGLQYYEFEKKQ